MVSDILEESSDILRQVFSEVIFIFDELLGTPFLGSFFYFVLVTATLLPVLRFIFSIFDVSFGLDSSEESAVCEFVKNGHCPYSLKEYNAEWCKEYCQINYQEDDLWK